MKTKPVTYTIPQNLDAILHSRIGRGEMSKFVTQALWDALRKQDDELVREKDALLLECLAADKDSGENEVRADFSNIEGEDFIGIDDFEGWETEQ